jgi:glucose-1-phosphate adenylyltransferase
VSGCIVGEGTEIYGEIYDSVIGSGVTVEEGAVIANSIIMNGCKICAGAKIYKSILAENVTVGERTELGVFEEKENQFKPEVYAGGLVTVGEYSVIPPDVRIGKNVAIAGVTTREDYPEGILDSGESIIRQ